jgi:3'-phosphoadenosine 5'-phosphosulfate sulfotransferase (PAPS reductase)/FAD synthetase
MGKFCSGAAYWKFGMLTVAYISGGVSSAVAIKLVIGQVDRLIYMHIDDQHPDTMRFLKDCERWYDRPIEVWQSKYRTVEEVCRAQNFIRSPRSGAVCTKHLKRLLRLKFEYENAGNMRIVWGLDCSPHEKERAERNRQAMPDHEHLFPLIDAGIDKTMAHQILAAAGIKRPEMYDLGYNNNNCIGCVKAGMGYWNHIRVDFPEVFAARSKMERDIGFSIIKGVYLDELDPEQGRHTPPIVEDCGVLCEAYNMWYGGEHA